VKQCKECARSLFRVQEECPGGHTRKGLKLRREDCERKCTSDSLKTQRIHARSVQELVQDFCEKVSKWVHQKVKLRRSSASLHRESARSVPEVKCFKFQSQEEEHECQEGMRNC
jgi:hypothetical protein